MGRNLHTQITTRYHDSISTMKYFINIFKSFCILNFCNNWNIWCITLLQKSLDEIDQNRPEEPKMTDVARAVEMTRIGKELSDGHKDIVLMGIPADLSWSFAQLKLAFFTDKLTEEEQKKIYDLRLLSDRVKFNTKHGIGYGIFKIDLK